LCFGNRRRYVEEKNIVIASFSEASITYIYNACRKEKYLTEITPTN